MAHQFEPSDAKEYGVIPAVILFYIRRWIEKNQANEKHLYEGAYWTYNSVSAFARMFPYLTPKQIRTALDRLEEAGAIRSGKFNKAGYDRTKWYTVCPVGQMDVPCGANGFDPKGEPIPSVPHIDIHTNEYLIKPTKKKNSRAGNFDLSTLGLDESSIKLVEKWLQYKRTRGQTYKSIETIAVFVKRLRDLSGGKFKTAQEIIEFSISNNYAGIFPIKDVRNGRTKTSDEDLARILIEKRKRDITDAG